VKIYTLKNNEIYEIYENTSRLPIKVFRKHISMLALQNTEKREAC